MADKHISNEEVRYSPSAPTRSIPVAAKLIPAQFFARLKELFDARRTKDHGTVYLTQKRRMPSSFPRLDLTGGCRNSHSNTKRNTVTFDLNSREATPTKVADDPLWDTHPPNPLPIIVRATNGKSKDKRDRKVKLSTIVQPDQLDSFYARYADVCKSGMSSLKPRDRSKRKKDKRKKKATGGGEGEKKA